MRAILFLIVSLISTCICAQDDNISFDHYAIQVRNLKESSDFYLNVVGLKEIENKTGKDHIRWFSMGGTAELHVIENKTFRLVAEKGIHLALRAKDLDAFINRLRKSDIIFYSWLGMVGTTNTRPDGIRQVYFQDPSGYWIEVNGK